MGNTKLRGPAAHGATRLHRSVARTSYGATPVAVAAALLFATTAVAAPTISSVVGCTDDGTGLTVGCPAAGNISITITGSNFGADQGVVRIDGSSCPPTSWSDSMVICTLPEGTGRSRLVSVEDVASVTSPPVRALSYEDPVISSVDGCGAAGCARGGGTTLTISGYGFGSSGARVLVGGEDCDDDSTPDTQTELTCTAPAGSGMKPVRILTPGAGLSTTEAEVAYAQCPPGTHVSGSSCEPCQAGFYSSDYDAPACRSCASGTFADALGSSSCSPCDAGSFAPYPGSSVCQPCPDGSNSTSGATSCLARDTMQCWKAKDLKTPAPFEPTELSVEDEFVASPTVQVKKLGFVCLPSDIASSGVVDPQAYQCCYKSTGDKLVPPATGTITDPIGGTLGFEASKRDLTCTPCKIAL